MALDRDRALALMQEYTASDALRKHMYAVELAMRAMAARAGEDADAWGLVGLVHDFDYERFPNAGPLGHRGAPGRGRADPHRARAPRGERARDPGPRAPTPACRATRRWPGRSSPWTSCAASWWPARWCGRPGASQDLEVSSVKKKLKDKAFARGVSREDVLQGAAELGVPLDEHIAFVLEALRPHERVLGLGAP